VAASGTESSLRFSKLAHADRVADERSPYAAFVDVEAAVRLPARVADGVHTRTAALVLAGFACLVILAHRWGESLVSGGTNIKLGVPPIHAVRDFSIGRGHIIVLVLAVVVVRVLPRAATRLEWRLLLLVAFATTVTWTVALNATRGASGLVQGLTSSHQYLNDVPAVGTPGAFLRGFVDNIDAYATHTQGHPPGFVLVLWLLDSVGLHGAAWAAALCIVAGALAVPAVLVAVRDVAGERAARAALPFVAVSPLALWVGSSADAFFAGISAVGSTAVVRAISHPKRSTGVAFTGGLLLGGALLCSYGLVLLLLVPAAVAIARGRVGALVVAGLGIAVVLGLAFAAGFDYLDGLRATRAAYFDGVASVRPYGYALVANVAALALAVGPATAVAIARLRGSLWLLVGSALVAVALANVSGMSKLEVERIWLPFSIWLLPAGAAFALRGSARMVPAWLTLQIGFAVVVHTVVRTGW